jgi:hypothetical protein
LSIEPTASVLWAAVGGVVVGHLHLQASVWRVRRTARVVFRGLWRERSAVAVVTALDIAGGLLPAVLIMATGVSRPEWAVTQLQSHPTWGWMAIGVLGPAAADRTFVGSAVSRAHRWLRYERFRDESSDKKPEGLVRATAVQEVVEGVAALAFGELHSKDVQIRNDIERRVATYGEADVRATVSSITQYLGTVGSQRSDAVRSALDRVTKSMAALDRDNAAADENLLVEQAVKRLKALLHALLNDGHYRIVSSVLSH